MTCQRTYVQKKWETLRILYLTSVNRILLEKLRRVPCLVKEFPAFYGTRNSISAFIKPTTCPYPKPVQPSPPTPTPNGFFKIQFHILWPMPRCWLRFLFWFPHQKPCMQFCFPPYVPHDPPISLSLISTT